MLYIQREVTLTVLGLGHHHKMSSIVWLHQPDALRIKPKAVYIFAAFQIGIQTATADPPDLQQ